MAASTTKQWGVTPPISQSIPTEKERVANDALMAELKSQNNFESPEETKQRGEVLKAIQKIVVEFVKHVCKEVRKLPHNVVEAAGGKIFTYGSYRLGVYGPGSDIDTLVVTPKYVQREDFFEYLPKIINRMAPKDAIKDMTAVPDAFVPIIKFLFSGISIDLIFSHLNVTSIPEHFLLKDPNLLRGLDDRGLRCLNGTRVTDEILELVPQKTTFRTALRGIKLWAQRRAIYANIMGYPGGVAWAMLVARVCQLYPQATGAVIIGKTFRIIGNWSWPQPVMLKNIEDGPLQARVWNPKIYKGDAYHLMPIITPAYPSMCATHNITLSARTIILRELKRGGDITDKIFTGQRQWKDLFVKHSFFTNDYKYYLSIITASRTKEAQKVWSGHVESKVRLLVQSLDSQDSIEIARPFNQGFARVHHCKNEEEIQAVLHGDLKYQAPDVKTETTDDVKDPTHAAAADGGAEEMKMPNGDAELSPTIKNGTEVHTIHTTTYYIGIELRQDGNKRLDISYETKNYKDTCLNWVNYNEELNSLNINHIRNYDLPADVFESGETKPTRPTKKKVVVKKRPLDDQEDTNPVTNIKRVKS